MKLESIQFKWPWVEPLQIISNLKKIRDDFICLVSSLEADYSNGRSYICLMPKRTIVGDDIGYLSSEISSNKDRYFGYLSYGIKNQLYKLPTELEFNIKLPNYYFVSFHIIILFDHKKKEIYITISDESYKKYIEEIFCISQPYSICNTPDIKISNLQSNMSKDEYIEKVIKIKEYISNGDFYQANLTRKFYGKIEINDPISLFIKLSNISPSPYGSLLKLDNQYILSSSPEQFLEIDNFGNAKSSPIKGTIRRGINTDEDNYLKEYLRNSKKDISENLMIVDLMRNDFSKGCASGTVKVVDLYKIVTLSNLHHLYTEIHGIKKNNVEILDFIWNCFPPGSMTGAPKIQAMKICTELEKYDRSVYSGCIGFIDNLKNETNLSVVIRTIIIDGNDFEFQVGGAIIWESDPEKEWEETIIKAKGILKILKLEEGQIF